MSDIPRPPGAPQAQVTPPPPPPPRILNAQLPPPQVPAVRPKPSGRLKPGMVIGIVGGLIGVAGLGGVVVAATGDDDPPAPIEDDSGTALDVDDPIDVNTPATAPPDEPADPEPDDPQPVETDPQSTGPQQTLPQGTSAPSEDTRPQELPSDTIDISEPDAGSVPAPPTPSAPVTAPPVVTNTPEPPPTDPAPIPDVNTPDGGVELPAGWEIVAEDEGDVALSNGRSFIELYFRGPVADEALALTQIFIEDALSEWVTDLDISEPVPLEPPTSSVVSAAGLNYQGLSVSQSGSSKVEGALWAFVFTDGTTLVAFTTDDRGKSAENIDAQIDILFIYLG